MYQQKPRVYIWDRSFGCQIKVGKKQSKGKLINMDDPMTYNLTSTLGDDA